MRSWINGAVNVTVYPFLSIQAQDFIEEFERPRVLAALPFLSIQAQDFIEDAGALPCLWM